MSQNLDQKKGGKKYFTKKNQRKGEKSEKNIHSIAKLKKAINRYIRKQHFKKSEKNSGKICAKKKYQKSSFTFRTKNWTFNSVLQCMSNQY